MTDMTLEQVRDNLIKEAEWYESRLGDYRTPDFRAMADAIDDHLAKAAQPGEAMDEDLVGEIVGDICELTKADPDSPHTVCVNVDSLIASIKQTLTAALAHPRPTVDAVLDAPALVGHTQFGKGIPWSTVIACAQRHYTHKDDPKPTPEMIQCFRDGFGKTQDYAPAAAPDGEVG